MTSDNNVLKQMDFLIMLTLYENKDYERGVTSRDLVFELIDNKPLWFQVGQVRDDKKFETSLKGALSRLHREKGYLNTTASKRYIKSHRFEEGFCKIISELYEGLGIDIEFPEEYWLNSDIDKEFLIEKVEDGTILYSFMNYHDTKKLNMLTDKQIEKLVKLIIEFDIFV